MPRNTNSPEVAQTLSVSDRRFISNSSPEDPGALTIRYVANDDVPSGEPVAQETNTPTPTPRRRRIVHRLDDGIRTSHYDDSEIVANCTHCNEVSANGLRESLTTARAHHGSLLYRNMPDYFDALPERRSTTQTEVPENTTCHNCHTPVDNDNALTMSDNFYCASCFTDDSFAHNCRGCGYRFTNDHLISPNNNSRQFYCTAHCAEQYITNCSRCDTRVDSGNTIGEDFFCNTCSDEIATRCDNCNNLDLNGDVRDCEECNEALCHHCFENHQHDLSTNERREEALRYRKVPEDTFLESDLKGCAYITHNRFVGVEIEAERGRLDYLYKVLPNEVGISGDGSLGDSGVEVQTAPAQGRKLEQLIADSCRAIKSQGYRSTTKCGLHVHIDARDIRTDHNKIIQVIKTFYATEDLLLSMLPPSRWASTGERKNYCQRLSRSYLYKNFNKKIDDINKLELEWYQTKSFSEKENRKRRRYDSARYYGVNIHSIFLRGTVEIRYHSGTTNYEKILNWVQLLLCIYEYATNRYDENEVQKLFDMATGTEKLELFYNIFGIKGALKSYMVQRINRFNPNFIFKFNKGIEERRREARKMAVVNKKIKEAMKEFEARAIQEVEGSYPPYYFDGADGKVRKLQEVKARQRMLAKRKLGIVDSNQEQSGFMNEQELVSVVSFIEQGMQLARNNDRLARENNTDDLEE